jgi:hypothetical protein
MRIACNRDHKQSIRRCPNMSETRRGAKLSSGVRGGADEHAKHGENLKIFIQEFPRTKISQNIS